MGPNEPSLFLDFVRLFNEGKYFEGHEALESLWSRTAGEEKLFYQGLIQAAVALHHHEKGNAAGAEYELGKCREKLLQYPSEYRRVFIPHLIDQLEGAILHAAPERPRIRLL